MFLESKRTLQANWGRSEDAPVYARAQAIITPAGDRAVDPGGLSDKVRGHLVSIWWRDQHWSH